MTTAFAQPRVPVIDGLGAIADRYDVVLCDIWGVLHNGRESFRPASDALVAFRKRGGAVVLVSNAPRPSPPIREQVIGLGVSPDAFDAVVTSGDVTIGLIAERGAAPVHHIGPARDLSLFDAAAELGGARPRLVPAEQASYILCTGLFDDEVETPDHYAAALSAFAARRLPFVCANPDLIVHRGKDLIYCAGALAQAYETLGGEVVYAGKPHAPIYQAALAAAAAARGAPVERPRVLAIGDAMRTDVAGAAGQGLDALFVTSGIHREDLHGEAAAAAADPLHSLFAREKLRPIAAAYALAP
ncbi:MAG: TIGR01459 family HAD-type hydrolase [Hyphomicrobiales bacterium]|nr:TIGR01459 family HAD-type hydrolase [Hyphomicrobiales bacterium]